LRIFFFKIRAPPGQFSLTLRIFFFKIRVLPSHICQEIVKQRCSDKKQINEAAKKRKQKSTDRHLPPPNQIHAAEAALDSNAPETKLFLGQRHPATSAN
jgi:hypothetical protein